MRKSRPLTAPASRFKKKRFPPEITGIPSCTASPRINSTRPLSSIQRPVSAPITPARNQFDELSSTFENFAEQTSVNITSPFLVAQFNRFSTNFNHFCDISSTIKNSFFGNYAQRMKINNSAIIVQARTMMEEWNDFQHFFIEVKAINIVPIYKLISNCLTNLSSAINDCYDLCGVGSRFETIPKPFQRYIDEEIKSLNHEALCICNERVKTIDPYDYYNRTIIFIQKTQGKLLNSFFKNRMTTADVMRRKMALNIAYEDLVKNLNGTQNFDFLAKEVEDQIILMNQSIGDLYNSLHLPIQLRKVKPILDDEGRSLNLSILRPAAAMIIDKTEAVKESSRRAESIKAQIEKVESRLQNRKKNSNQNEIANNNENNKNNENTNYNNDNDNNSKNTNNHDDTDKNEIKNDNDDKNDKDEIKKDNDNNNDKDETNNENDDDKRNTNTNDEKNIDAEEKTIIENKSDSNSNNDPSENKIDTVSNIETDNNNNNNNTNDNTESNNNNENNNDIQSDANLVKNDSSEQKEEK